MVIRLAGGGHLNYLGTLPVLVLATEAPGSDILGRAPPPPAPLTPVCHPDQSLHQSTWLQSSHSYLRYLSQQLGLQIQDNDSQKSQNTLNFYKILLRDNWKMCLKLEFCVPKHSPQLHNAVTFRKSPCLIFSVMRWLEQMSLRCECDIIVSQITVPGKCWDEGRGAEVLARAAWGRCS